MKKIIFIILFVFLFFQNSFSQINKKIDIPEALNYLNLFLNDVNPLATITGKITYNNYAETFSYVSKCEAEEIKTSLNSSFSFNINDVISIDEMILKSKDYNSSSLAYTFYLKNEVYRESYTKIEGSIIKDFSSKKDSKVWFSTEKSLTENDVLNIKRTIRDIFKNIPVKTEIKNY
jgi:hypothetical protein